MNENRRSPESRPMFRSDWLRALFLHFETDPDTLQRQVPYPLDLDREGRAIVSLVCFRMRGLRFDWPTRAGRLLGRLAALPCASHELLNVRTYVRVGDEVGIYFMTEWIPNALSVLLGPRTHGLPYRLGSLDYRHRHEEGTLDGEVAPRHTSGRVAYRARLSRRAEFEVSERGSLDEFLLERYIAWTHRPGRRRMFRIWHEPWRQCRADVEWIDTSALAATGPWFEHARRIGANYSPGTHDVWMGRPRSVAARPKLVPSLRGLGGRA